jgi:hypothetical protein
MAASRRAPPSVLQGGRAVLGPGVLLESDHPGLRIRGDARSPGVVADADPVAPPPVFEGAVRLPREHVLLAVVDERRGPTGHS